MLPAGNIIFCLQLHCRVTFFLIEDVNFSLFKSDNLRRHIQCDFILVAAKRSGAKIELPRIYVYNKLLVK